MNLTDEYIVMLVEKFAWRRSKKDRPVIVVAVATSSDSLTVFPSTTQEELCVNDKYFCIDEGDPQFEETKLRYSSCIVDEVIDVPITPGMKRLGVIKGDLKRRFDEAFGL